MEIVNSITGSGVKLSDDPDIWELNKAAYFFFSKQHYMGYDYRKHRPKEFKGADLKPQFMADNHFLMGTTYVAYLSHQMLSWKSPLEFITEDQLPDFELYKKIIPNEISRIEEEGELCIYCSILLYLILQQSKILKPHLKYVQGLYKFRLRDDWDNMFPVIIPMAEWQQGMHSWVMLGDSILDYTITQNNDFFNFKDEDTISGKAPEGMQLLGHEELEAIVRKYQKKYAAAAGLDPDEWMVEHMKAAMQFMLKTLNQIMQPENIDRIVQQHFNRIEKEVEADLHKDKAFTDRIRAELNKEDK